MHFYITTPTDRVDDVLINGIREERELRAYFDVPAVFRNETLYRVELDFDADLFTVLRTEEDCLVLRGYVDAEWIAIDDGLPQQPPTLAQAHAITSGILNRHW